MEQDVQLQRGLSREVLRHGWLPRLRNVVTRFTERSVNLCPSALCCSKSSSSPRRSSSAQQANAIMNKVLRESYQTICLPQFMTAEETPSPVKSSPGVHRPAAKKAETYPSDDDQPSTLARMSSSSTSTDELYCAQPRQSADAGSSLSVCNVHSTTVKKDLTKNTVDSATQYETVDVDLCQSLATSVVKDTGTQFSQTEAVSTQTRFPVASTGTQHDLETKELTIQATKETTSMGIQCAHEMVSATTQAGPSVQSAEVQVMADMVNSASQAVVETSSSGVQAVQDTMTQGTQYEFIAATRSTQTEEEYLKEDHSPADLRDEIVCLVQRYINKDSKVLHLDKFIDVEDKVRQFLDIMEATYKDSPPQPEAKSHPLSDAAPQEMAPICQEPPKSAALGQQPPPPPIKTELSHMNATPSALGMSQSDTGLCHTDLQSEDECTVEPLLSLPSCGVGKVEGILDEWKREDISKDGKKFKICHGQDSKESVVGKRCELALENKESGGVQSITNTKVARESRQDIGQENGEDTSEKLELSANSSCFVSSQSAQEIRLGLHTDNIPDLNVASNMEDLPSSYFNILADIGSFWRECSSGPTTGQHIPDPHNSPCGPVTHPADPLKPQAGTDTDNQDSSMVCPAQSVTFACDAASEDIWGEIEDAMEGCGEPEISNQTVEAVEPKEEESPRGHEEIPLPGARRLRESLSIPGFLLLNHDVPDRRGHALHVRGGVKSDGDKDHTTYAFDWDEAIDFTERCELVPRPSENLESHPGDVKQHVDSFAVNLTQLLQQVQDNVRGFATESQKDSRVAEVNSSSESFAFVNNDETRESNSVSSDDAAPTVMHVEDFLDVQHKSEPGEIEHGWVNVQKVKISPAIKQSQGRCGNDASAAQVEGSAEEGGAVGGFAVECFPPRLYQDAEGYQVPDIDVPAVLKDDIEAQLRDDGTKWVLGTGSFGAVEAAFYKSPEGPVVEVAVKKFFRENSEAIIREGKMMQYLQKTCVFPKFYGFMNIGKDSQCLCLVSELFARGTTLGDILHGVGYSLEPSDWMNICMQLARGLLKLHQMQVIFSDLKENNVLVDLSGTPVVKLIDLGISTLRQGISYDFTADELRPLRHIAPEVRHGSPTSFLSDIWGLGIMLLDIATISGAPGLEHVAEAALAENPEQRVCLEGIITALAAIASSQKLF